MNISFQAVGHEFLTFGCTATDKEGYPCKMSANGTVTAGASGDAFMGILGAVRDGSARVLFRGYYEIAYSGTAPSLGYAILAADGDGGVKAATTGHEYLVMNVDTTNGTLGIFL